MNITLTSEPKSSAATPVASVTLPNIALLGKAGAGKDLAAASLRGAYGYNRSAFADKLKDVAASIWGETARTNREYLQQLGVAVREIDNDAWVNAIVLTNPSVVTDVRFPNEVRALLGHGFVTVKVVADRGTRLNRLVANGKLQDEAQLDHVSETALDGYTPDYVALNTGTIEEFGHRLFEIVETERARRG